MGSHVSERESHVREFEMVETGALRARLEGAIEALISLLDQLDDDPDREPSFGNVWDSSLDELEEDDPPEDGGDAEPWLGSRELYPSLAPCYREGWDQRRWGHGKRSDCEMDAGDEPEYDEADWGIADRDALQLVEAAGLPPVDALWRR